MEKIVSIGVSLVLVGFFVWWFFGKRRASVQAAEVVDGVQTVEIVVDGGYHPQVVELKAGLPAQLIFHRKDPSSCLEEVVMPDFGVSKMLPLGEKTVIELAAQTAGDYKYVCGMNMFSGRVVVK